MPKYEVELEVATVEYNSEWVTVEAEDAEDAADQAIDQFASWIYEDVEVVHVELIEE